MAHDPKQPENLVRSNLDHVRAAPKFKPMFGGILGYVDGQPWVSCSDVGLAVKLSPAEQEELLKLPGARRLQYEPSMPPSKQYISVPDSMLDDHAALAGWLGKSADYVGALPPKKKKK